MFHEPLTTFKEIYWIGRYSHIPILLKLSQCCRFYIILNILANWFVFDFCYFDFVYFDFCPLNFFLLTSKTFFFFWSEKKKKANTFLLILFVYFDREIIVGYNFKGNVLNISSCLKYSFVVYIFFVRIYYIIWKHDTFSLHKKRHTQMSQKSDI